MKSAFLFDIDGCLTLPNKDISVLDLELLDQIIEFDVPFAFITGRSDGWIRKQYREYNRNNYLNIRTYIEFGLAWIDGPSVQLQQSSTKFLDTREIFIEKLDDLCSSKNIYFEADTWYDDYPDHGSLWVERKHIQLSIAENKNLRANKLHDLVKTAWEDLQSEARILFHHLGVDVIPKNWSKSCATSHFIETLNETEFSWYVFGDNDSDKEMARGLTNVEFISTKLNASLDVREKLSILDFIN